MDTFNLTDNVFSWGLTLFVVNVIVILFLINKIFEERRKNRRLKKQSKSDTEVVIDFLDGQNKRSKELQVIKRTAAERRMQSLRVAYTKIESNALRRELNSSSYDQYIQENLHKLYETLRSSGVEAKKALLREKVDVLEKKIVNLPVGKVKKDIHENAVNTVKKYKSLLDSSDKSPEFFDRKLSKLSEALEAFESPDSRKKYLSAKVKRDYINNSQASINRLHRNQMENEDNIERLEKFDKFYETETLVEEVARFKRENKKLQDHIKDLQKNMSRLNATANIEVKAAYSDGGDKRAFESDNYSDVLLEQNEFEIDRLRGVISNQRHSILEMEEAIEEMEKASEAGNSEQLNQIQQLKQCIRDSENCIATLEAEIDALKRNLDDIKQSNSQEMTDADIQHLNDELRNAYKSLSESGSRQQVLEAMVEFLREMLAARTVEDLSLLVYENIVNLKYSPNILMRSPSRTIELSQSGEIPTRDKVMAENMRINEINPGKNGQLAFRLRNLSGVLRPTEAADDAKTEHDYFSEILRFSDLCIDLLATSHSDKSRGTVSEFAVKGIKEVAFNVDQNLAELGGRLDKVFANHFEQVQDLLRAKGLGAGVIAKVSQIEQEAMHQLANEKNIKIKVRRQLLALMDEIESRKKAAHD